MGRRRVCDVCIIIVYNYLTAGYKVTVLCQNEVCTYIFNLFHCTSCRIYDIVAIISTECDRPAEIPY